MTHGLLKSPNMHNGKRQIPKHAEQILAKWKKKLLTPPKKNWVKLI